MLATEGEHNTPYRVIVVTLNELECDDGQWTRSSTEFYYDERYEERDEEEEEPRNVETRKTVVPQPDSPGSGGVNPGPDRLMPEREYELREY